MLSLLREQRTFVVLWATQLVSLVGSQLTGFALGLWIYQQNQSVSQFALVGLCTVLPQILFSPLAGGLVDRWDKRYVMLLSDTGSGLTTLVIVILLVTRDFTAWHAALVTFISSAFGAFQWPAYAAAITSLVPVAQLDRANGLVQLGQGAAGVLAPLLAGAILGTSGLPAIVLIDGVTFLVAVTALLLLRFPVALSDAGQSGAVGPGRLDLLAGLRYIAAQPALRGLMVFSTVINFLWGMVGALIVPLLLGFASEQQLGLVITLAGVGMLSGGAVMSLWGGPSRRIRTVLLFEAFGGLCFCAIGLRPELWLTVFGAFCAHFTIAFVNGSTQTIWQVAVPAELQGRVFAALQVTTRALSPLAFLLAGPLADHVFVPLLLPDGLLAESIGGIVGTGPGRGIGLLFVLMGLMKILTVLLSLSNRAMRSLNVEDPESLLTATVAH